MWCDKLTDSWFRQGNEVQKIDVVGNVYVTQQWFPLNFTNMLNHNEQDETSLMGAVVNLLENN